MELRSAAPHVSVILPARDAATVLPHALGALRASDLPGDAWELIVVDDASNDGTAERAAQYADRVVRLSGSPRGPAYARNRGAEVARGEVLVFVDADVCVHPDALRRFAEALAREPAAAAVFGAYDTSPSAPGLVSQYRNLLHHYVHLRDAGDAETFWAGCGAIRRDVFVRVGMFDEERYRRPQIEDIELGHRVREAGHRILLCPAIQGTHLKGWTLRSMIVNDVCARGVPWMRLLLSQRGRRRAGTLNLRPREKLYTALVGLAALASAAAAGLRDARWLLLAAACLIMVLLGNAALLHWFARQRGIRFAAAVIPLRLLYYALNGLAAVLGSVPYRADRTAPALDAPDPPAPVDRVPTAGLAPRQQR